MGSNQRGFDKHDGNDIALTPTEAQFLLDQISRQGVPFGHPNGHEVFDLGTSCLMKLTAIVEGENGISQQIQ